jgi:ferrous iron transport protein A
MTLDQLAVGQCAEIKDIAGRGAFRRRLLELGLLPGTAVVRTGQAPLGDPLAFRVRGAVFSLRRADAVTVTVADASHVTEAAGAPRRR